MVAHNSSPPENTELESGSAAAGEAGAKGGTNAGAQRSGVLLLKLGQGVANSAARAGQDAIGIVKRLAGGASAAPAPQALPAPDDDDSPTTQMVRRTLAPVATRSSVKRRVAVTLASSVGASMAAAYVLWPSVPEGPQFETAAIKRGDLSVRVIASGKLQPTNVVNISSEVSGAVRAVLTDVNEVVKKGQTLAEIDRAQLQGELERMRHARDAAEARLAGVRTNTELRKRDWDRTSWGAAIREAQAEVAAAEANLRLAGNALKKTVITSPIDGVVLKRAVDPGQTVAASFSAPTLFVLAEDLKRMQLIVDVDEADVSRVKAGQKATFEVQALKDQRFRAEVETVHLSGQDNQGVITYKAVLAVANDDLKLRPDMTAVAKIRVTSADNALLVPNSAMRVKLPDADKEAEEPKSLLASLQLSPPTASDAKKPRAQNSGRRSDSGKREVYVLREGKPVLVPITVGATDGKMSVVTDGELKAGDQVITRLGAKK